MDVSIELLGYEQLKVRIVIFQGLTWVDIGSLLKFSEFCNKEKLLVFLGLGGVEVLDTRD